MNKIMLIGNLTRDPETRMVEGMNGATPCCQFGIAVNKRVRRQNSTNAQDETQFFNISVWGNRADPAQKYLKKGHKVFVCGELNARTYVANDGSTRLALDVRADDFEFLTTRAEAEAMGGRPAYAPAQQPAPTAQNSGFAPVESDDLPF